MIPFKVTFHLDGTGLFYDPAEPIMLDGLLAWAVARWHVSGEPPARDEPPAEIPLPLAKWRIGDHWGYHASALFPDGPTHEQTVFWRKRLRQGRIERASGSPNLTNGTYRDWNMPLPLLLCHRMVAYGFGDRRVVRHELKRNVRYLGKKRAHGRGQVVEVEVEESPHDFSLVRNGKAQRWLPDDRGVRIVRTRSPYWSSVGGVRCCEIGDDITPEMQDSIRLR